MLQILQQKYEYLRAINDDNNKTAVLAARDAYVTKMKSEMNQAGVSSDKLRAQHEEACSKAEEHLEQQRNRPSNHDDDPYLKKLLEVGPIVASAPPVRIEHVLKAAERSVRNEVRRFGRKLRF